MARKPKRLPRGLRDQLRGYLFQELMSSMWGDGLENDYIRDGINFKGLDNMTDLELYQELLEGMGGDLEMGNASDYVLVKKIKRYLK